MSIFSVDGCVSVAFKMCRRMFNLEKSLAREKDSLLFLPKLWLCVGCFQGYRQPDPGLAAYSPRQRCRSTVILPQLQLLLCSAFLRVCRFASKIECNTTSTKTEFFGSRQGFYCKWEMLCFIISNQRNLRLVEPTILLRKGCRGLCWAFRLYHVLFWHWWTNDACMTNMFVNTVTWFKRLVVHMCLLHPHALVPQPVPQHSMSNAQL